MSASLSHHGAKSVAPARREHSALRAPPPDKIRHQRQARARYELRRRLAAFRRVTHCLQICTAPLVAELRSGQAGRDQEELGAAHTSAARPAQAAEAAAVGDMARRDTGAIRRDRSRSNQGPVRRRSTAAPNPAAGFASAVLSCELSVARGAQPRAGAPRRPDSVIVLTVVCA